MIFTKIKKLKQPALSSRPCTRHKAVYETRVFYLLALLRVAGSCLQSVSHCDSQTAPWFIHCHAYLTNAILRLGSTCHGFHLQQRFMANSAWPVFVLQVQNDVKGSDNLESALGG
jgi:hypothetical protein